MLRHFFNESGLYCINVSMSNDVSFAATSAKVNVDMGMHDDHNAAFHPKSDLSRSLTQRLLFQVLVCPLLDPLS